MQRACMNTVYAPRKASRDAASLDCCCAMGVAAPPGMATVASGFQRAAASAALPTTATTKERVRLGRMSERPLECSFTTHLLSRDVIRSRGLQVARLNGQPANTLARRVENRIRQGRRDGRNTGLADAAHLLAARNDVRL